jgi:predicted HTH transcriptional regulator
MEHAVLKTIAGFLNHKGGFLLVGVKDNKEVIGLDNDKFKTEDDMMLHLGNIIKRSIGKQFGSYIMPRIEDCDGKRILVIECHPSRSPVYVKDGQNEKFYVRGPADTDDLSISEAQAYIKDRFE